MKYILKWFLFSLAFVPLLVNLDTLFPFIFTKTLLIRAAITLFWVFFAVWFFTRKDEAKATLDENWRFVKNPLYIFVSLFVLLMFLSTIFAVDITRAFFGDIERGEGYLGMLHFFSFFIASLLVFKKEDWATFFRLNLITGAILFADSIDEFASGEFTRAQSLVGNPIFLAVYFLFVMLSAFLSYSMSRGRIGWRIFSFLMIFASTVGIFLTETRGVILGLVVGVAVVVLHFVIKGRGVATKIPGLKLDLQKVGIVLLTLGVLGMGALVFTRDNPFWQKIPGVGRFATISLEDRTLQTRLISAGVSLDAVNPAENGVHRFLIGYGWDNFNIAYNKHYDPEYMRYESLWFDRAHNKLLDILVMTGVLGFVAYVGAWLAAFYLIFRRVREREYAVPLILFGTAYFVQNLFVFDQISTYIPFFAFLAFTVFVSSEPGEISMGKWLSGLKKLFEYIVPYKLPVVAVLFSFALLMYTIIPYSQSVEFIGMLKARSESPEKLVEKAESFSKPYTYAQSTIRNRFLSFVMPGIGDPNAKELVNMAIALHEEFIAKEPYDPRDISLIGTVYRVKGNLGEPGAYEKAEEYFLRSLELSPTRQDHFYNLGTLYADQGDFVAMQEYAAGLIAGSPDVPRTKILYGTLIIREGTGRYAEAMSVIGSAVDDPDVYFLSTQETGILRTAYNQFINHFSQVRDGELYLTALEGARDLELRLKKISEERFVSGTDALRLGEFEREIELFKQGGWANVNL